MRPIEFRGKREDNDEWVYGGVYVSKPFGNYKGEAFIIDCYKKAHKVVYDTVGQFTGLHDKNGKKIFEGDIVQFYRSGKKIVGAVEYRGCSFTVIHGGIGYNLDIELLITDSRGEIIGNIHDNAELLGGAE